jgi:hypothetical protein
MQENDRRASLVPSGMISIKVFGRLVMQGGVTNLDVRTMSLMTFIAGVFTLLVLPCWFPHRTEPVRRIISIEN